MLAVSVVVSSFQERKKINEYIEKSSICDDQHKDFGGWNGIQKYVNSEDFLDINLSI